MVCLLSIRKLAVYLLVGRQVGHRRESSVRWLDPNFVIHGCANSLFAAKMSRLALCEFLSVRVRQLSKDYGKVLAPSWKTSSAGTIVLADFNQPILPRR